MSIRYNSLETELYPSLDKMLDLKEVSSTNGTTHINQLLLLGTSLDLQIHGLPLLHHRDQ
jgi:hypothetical protein